jgi:TPP-dependent pyruvate/acetoin dehydrogenase alpha subunit/ABC-type Na+ transport system ATPase subunit NatA
VSFSVARGEIFCLLGPNGAGKTTTTEILEGYRAMSSGAVSVLGHNPALQERELRDRVGIVLQQTGVQGTLTVEELLEMYGGWFSRSRSAAELIALVGLDGKVRARVEELSGGQKRRLDLALALVGEPELLFLDEPTTGFDPEARRRAWRTIRELSDQGTTIFLTTHFMDEAQFLADTVAVMAKGVAPMEVMAGFRGDWHSGYDPKQYKVSIQSTPLTTQLLHAVGVAHAAKLRGEDTVVLAMCGDGATSEGDFHEALNFAAVFNLPVIFFVQNNQYAISVPLSQQSVAPSLAHKAVGYGMAGERVDGNDLVALLAVLGRAVRLAREGNGPLLVEAHTYRMQAHTNADDATRYREDSEVQGWIDKDPVARMRTYLADAGLLPQETEARITAHAEAVATALRDGMNSENVPDPADLFAHVYSTPTTQMAEQAEMLADELAREEDAK